MSFVRDFGLPELMFFGLCIMAVVVVVAVAVIVIVLLVRKNKSKTATPGEKKPTENKPEA